MGTINYCNSVNAKTQSKKNAVLIGKAILAKPSQATTRPVGPKEAGISELAPC
jgi:hypothetical protein